jgi:hypothetical protein
MAGLIALILRGNCTFESKLTNAQTAGAVGAVVYAAPDSPEAIPMSVGAAVLPAMMVSNPDGNTIGQAIANQSSPVLTMNFSLSSTPVPANRLTDFTGAGPNVDLGIKPDLVAVGQNIYTATQTYDPKGDLYNTSGYELVDGTSFSAPLVAGAAALLKAARPGLTVDQYRSLLINSAAAVQNHTGQAAPVQQGGAGLMDVNAAMLSTITAYPVSLSFGAGDGNPQTTRWLTIGNLGTADDTYTVSFSAASGTVTPSSPSQNVTVAAGSTTDLPISFNSSGLTPGSYEGAVTITANSTGKQINVPYWYGATSLNPAKVVVLDSISSGRQGSVQIDAVEFRVVDAAGVPITAILPQVSVVSGGGSVRAINTRDANSPGVFGLDLRLGLLAGPNVFEITAGTASLQISITGQ